MAYLLTGHTVRGLSCWTEGMLSHPAFCSSAICLFSFPSSSFALFPPSDHTFPHLCPEFHQENPNVPCRASEDNKGMVESAVVTESSASPDGPLRLLSISYTQSPGTFPLWPVAMNICNICET